MKSVNNFSNDEVLGFDAARKPKKRVLKAIGKILSALLDEVIAGELENEHDALMKRAREIYTLVSSIYI